MPDLNLAFTLAVRSRKGEPLIIIRAFDDLGWDGAGRVKLTCEVRQGGVTIFPRGQLTCALHGSSDGVKARELVMSLVAMRPGDTDRDYFDGYTPSQLEWARANGEGLSCERKYRYCDANGAVRA